MINNVRKSFPKLLKYHLMMNKKTQKDLVNYLGVSQSAVSNWVTGIRFPDIEIVAKIAEFLHVEIQDLIQENPSSDACYTKEIDFANTFKYLREQYHLTQQQLADKIGVSRSTIGMYENGEREPNFETLELIADAFNVDMNYLLGKNYRNELLISEKKFNEIFAKRIRYYLKINGITQLELSKKLGVGTTSVYNWCNGIKIPRMNKIEAMCELFQCKRSDLMEDKDNSDDNELYYLNNDTKDMAQFLYENPDYKVLFDSARKVKKEDIAFIKEMMDRMSNRDE